jgi:hypothetical protein
MIANPLMAACAALIAGASAWAFWGGQWKTGVIYAAYAVANTILSTIKQ